MHRPESGLSLHDLLALAGLAQPGEAEHAADDERIDGVADEAVFYEEILEERLVDDHGRGGPGEYSAADVQQRREALEPVQDHGRAPHHDRDADNEASDYEQAVAVRGAGDR